MKNKTEKSHTYSRIALFLAIVVAVAFVYFFGKPATSNNGSSLAVSAPGKSFTLEIIDNNGVMQSDTYTTDETNLGEFLESEGIIAGEDGQFGLYVTEVNGLQADYDTDRAYWRLQVDGEDAPTGVDGVEIKPGATYTWIYTAE